jgi:sn-glycerol 3-phosphate transport system substrate-binding protein
MANPKRIFVCVLALMLAVMAFAPALAQDEPTEVRVLIAFTDYRLDWARERAAEFNEQFPEYNIVIEGLASYNDVFDAAVLGSEQGNQPAVIHFFEAATQEARDAVNASGEPLFKNIDEAIGDAEEINGVPVVLGDVVDSAAEYYTLGGEFTSMPWNTSSAIMFTNNNMLEAAGVEEIPETWAEIEAACATISSLEDGPDNCITWPNHSWFVEQTMAQQGELLANNNNGRDERATEVFLDSQGMIDYISWWQGLNDEGYYVYTGTQRDWTGTYNAFIAEQVAFLIYSSSDTTALTSDGTDAGFEVEASFMPYNDEGEYAGNIIGGATLWLTNGLDAEVETGALMFMNWFNNPENAADWHRVTGYIPITDPAIELLEEEGWFEENPNSRVAGDQLTAAAENDVNPGALIGNFVAIRDVITGAIEDILVNDLDVEERLTEANEEANLLLEEYNLLYVE